jgi:hypothetical protein
MSPAITLGVVHPPTPTSIEKIIELRQTFVNLPSPLFWSGLFNFAKEGEIPS